MIDTQIKNICFYYAHKQVVSGGLYYFYTLAKYCSEHTAYNIYIVNYKDSKYTSFFKKQYNCSKIHFFNYEDELNKFEKEDTLFFTYLNMLPLMLESFHNIKKGNIFLIDFHPKSLNFLFGNLQCLDNQRQEQIVKLIQQTSALSFMDCSYYYLLNEKSGIYFPKRYIPAFVDQTFPQYKNSKVISKNEINIGCVCRLDLDKINSVINFLNCIYDLNSDKKINVHVIGDGTHRNKINVKHYQSKFNLIMTSYITGTELKEYISQHVDMMFNFGVAALDVAAMKLPVAIPMYAMQPFKCNRFYFLFDSKDYNLGCEEGFVDKCKIKTYTIEEILNKLYQPGQKEKLGEKCFQYLQKNHLIQIAYKKFMQYAFKSQLTIGDCLKEKEIKKTVKEFHKYRQKGYLWDDYIVLRRLTKKQRIYKYICDKLNLKSKFSWFDYKIFKYCSEKLSKKNIKFDEHKYNDYIQKHLSAVSFKDKLYYKIWKHLSKKLLKKGIISKPHMVPLIPLKAKKKISLKNRIRYKIWKHLNKRMFAAENTGFVNKIKYKIWKHLNKKLSKKDIIPLPDRWEKLEQTKFLLVNQLRKTYKQKKIIKVAFLHQYVTSSQQYAIFERMLKSKIFDPYWIVNPDVSRSKENFDFQYKRTKETLLEKYGSGRVLDGYDYKTEKFIDYTSQFDLATSTNPYEGMANKLFQIRYWGITVPMFYISYFYMGRCFITIENLKNPQFNYFWKVFAENRHVKELAKKYQAVRGKNIIVTGYPKMDELSKIKIIPRQRKRIILAPHHTIDEEEIWVGAFLYYYKDLLEVVKKYPDIDFIYRPHPLLEERLKNLWGKEKTQAWLDKLLSYSNVTYSTEGEYLDIFANSDALIHDCGSFMAEYLFTEHPCAYWMKPTANYEKIHTEFGHKCMEAHYQIFNKQDLFDFINNVVVKGDDPKKQFRENFTKSELMINYPRATDKIMKILTREITGKTR